MPTDVLSAPATTAASVRRLPPLPMIVGAAFMVFLTLDQAHWWQLKADYSFGWLAPLFVGYLVYERWPQLNSCSRADGESALPAALETFLSVAAWMSLSLGLLLFLFGCLYRSASGATQPGSLALALGFAFLFPSLVFLATPAGRVAGNSSKGWTSDARVVAVASLVFPSLVWLISAPLVSAAEGALSLFLLRKVVKVVFFVFSSLGYPLVQEGNVLVLPLGRVGVADACSGIRSLTGCLFAGSFLAAVFLDRPWKKIALVVLALLLAIGANFLRSLFLTAWAYAYGSEAIEGTLHDATGYAVLGLTSVALFSLLPLFDGSRWRRWLKLDES